jgi:orotidine-5'-phosphate decarboxylase
MKQSSMKNPLIVALDVDSSEKAIHLAKDLGPSVGALKVGPRLVHRYGESLLRELASYAPIFVDCKFFDIPSTMEAAVRSSFDAGASLVTVHALAGREALTRLAKVEEELNKQRPFKILCVTILTSWDQQSLPPVMKTQSISHHVLDLADLAHNSGLTGLVCSAEELHLLKNQNHFLVVPGIRLAAGKKDDQKRVMGPGEAMKLGASALVVGRPIIEAKDPKIAVQEFLAALNG